MTRRRLVSGSRCPTLGATGGCFGPPVFLKSTGERSPSPVAPCVAAARTSLSRMRPRAPVPDNRVQSILNSEAIRRARGLAKAACAPGATGGGFGPPVSLRNTGERSPSPVAPDDGGGLARWMSAGMTRPPGPVPASCDSATPASLANRRTDGAAAGGNGESTGAGLSVCGDSVSLGIDSPIATRYPTTAPT